MASTPIVDIFRIPDLRKKVIFTIWMLILFRVGTAIPIPGVNLAALQELATAAGRRGLGFSISDYFDFFSGGAFNRYSILMLGIMPYITMSIIIQLLMVTVPALKRIAEEDGGRNKIKRYTRYGTVITCLIQALVLPRLANSDLSAIIHPAMQGWRFTLVSMLSVTTGTVLLMWMGEQITARGVGNGASLIIFAGIVARIPAAINIVKDLMPDQINPVFVLLAFIMYIAVVVLVVYEQQGQRKIPVHYARHIVRGRMSQGQRTYIPFKLNPAGVIPVIFGQAMITGLISLLGTLAGVFPWIVPFARQLTYGTWLNNVVYGLLIIFFAYLYTQLTLNPIEISRQIRNNGGSIPGVRSEDMEKYLTRILNRLVLPGSLFLALIALMPTVLIAFFDFPVQVAYLMGGTSLLIMVGVDLDTMAQIEGHLKMHNHEGLTKGGKLRSRNL